ncbi:hypothetical protein [Marinicellulosiphila megalodicopiae]|uniref:hypothetical protein n=1 Tax=Marinicellulosiphila megalodicopiae TaxID=2724896 RepID=UPI003BB20405
MCLDNRPGGDANFIGIGAKAEGGTEVGKNKVKLYGGLGLTALIGLYAKVGIEAGLEEGTVEQLKIISDKINEKAITPVVKPINDAVDKINKYEQGLNDYFENKHFNNY